MFGSVQSQPTDDRAGERQHSGRSGPEAPGGQAVNRSGGWLRNMRGLQHGMNKPRTGRLQPERRE